MGVAILPSHEAMVKRITRAYERSSDVQRYAGSIWYPSEAELIASIGARYGLDKRPSIASYAILSAKTRVQNARESFDALAKAASFGQDMPTTAALGKQAEKAWLLMHDNYAIHDTLTGPKVTSFACNLNGCPTHVTVDTWSARVAGAWGWRGDEPRYRLVEQAYLTAAKRLGVAPSVLQATTWLERRGVEASDRKYPTAWSDAL